MADEAADAKDFSAIELEIDVNGSRGAKAFRLKHESARRVRGIWRKQVPRVAAHHQTDEAGGIKPGQGAIGGDRSVLQDGYVVAEVDDLIQSV